VNFGPKSSSFRYSEAPATALPGGHRTTSEQASIEIYVTKMFRIAYRDIYKVMTNLGINPIMLDEQGENHWALKVKAFSCRSNFRAKTRQ
jgi:hypothetical protein